MKNWKDGFMLRAALTKEIKQVVAEKHKLDLSDFLINWIEGWRLIQYPTGLIAKLGKIKICVSGFKPTTFLVSQNKNCKWQMYQ
jgi:hypothetical protein